MRPSVGTGESSMFSWIRDEIHDHVKALVESLADG